MDTGIIDRGQGSPDKSAVKDQAALPKLKDTQGILNVLRIKYDAVKQP